MRSICLALCVLAAPLQAQEVAAGAELYRSYCATCHGMEGKGNGPMAPALILQPPDLTELSVRNAGVFPMIRVVLRIDGRDPLVAHGSPMPVYGDLFEGDDTALRAETGQPILAGRAVADLVAYLQSIQVDAVD